MRSHSGSKLAIAICILGTFFFTGTKHNSLAASSQCDDGVSVQVLLDKSLFAPGATIHVKFLVTNTSQTPLYLFHDIGQCSSQHGSLSLDLRDLHNQEVEYWGCSADDLSMNTMDVVQFLSSPVTGVLLQQGEIYGREEDYKLPKKKGIFRLHAEIVPVGFLTEAQNQALAQHQMKVLRNTCLARPLTITLK